MNGKDEASHQRAGQVAQNACRQQSAERSRRHMQQQAGQVPAQRCAAKQGVLDRLQG